MERHCRRILAFTLQPARLQCRYHTQSQPRKRQKTQTWGRRAPFSWSTFLNFISPAQKSNAERFTAQRKIAPFTLLRGWGAGWPLTPGNAAVLAPTWGCSAAGQGKRRILLNRLLVCQTTSQNQPKKRQYQHKFTPKSKTTRYKTLVNNSLKLMGKNFSFLKSVSAALYCIKFSPEINK